jgi:hypothetical protein
MLQTRGDAFCSQVKSLSEIYSCKTVNSRHSPLSIQGIVRFISNSSNLNH